GWRHVVVPSVLVACAGLLGGGCGSLSSEPARAMPQSDTPCTGGSRCSGTIFQVCEGGSLVDRADCAQGNLVSVFVSATGVQCCVPGGMICLDHDVRACGPDGTPGAVKMPCPQGCVDGQCPSPCTLAASARGYLGCRYWAVDLDNAVDVLSLATGASDCAWP